MRPKIIITGLSMLLSVDACYLWCKGGNGRPLNINMENGNPPACPGEQDFVFAAEGYADIVYFDGGKHYQCADHEGFSLKHIKQNVIACSNGVRGKCCGTERC
ncbi:hypothetical protein PWT90_06520 [Aphanocladium album]|nr:hypothetical protein PWT90_06520 [Aphanocladium album]